jgi:nitrogen regulatory protein P-II 2
MKYIVALIEDAKLGRVLQELDRNEIYLKTISRVQGSDAAAGIPLFRLEIAVNENYVRPAVDAVLNGARAGTAGAGKIFIQQLLQCVRVRNGDTGPIAIG